jgi:hypothetical protein
VISSSKILSNKCKIKNDLVVFFFRFIELDTRSGQTYHVPNVTFIYTSYYQLFEFLDDMFRFLCGREKMGDEIEMKESGVGRQASGVRCRASGTREAEVTNNHPGPRPPFRGAGGQP